MPQSVGAPPRLVNKGWWITITKSDVLIKSLYLVHGNEVVELEQTIVVVLMKPQAMEVVAEKPTLVALRP